MNEGERATQAKSMDFKKQRKILQFKKLEPPRKGLKNIKNKQLRKNIVAFIFKLACMMEKQQPKQNPGTLRKRERNPGASNEPFCNHLEPQETSLH